MSRQTPLATRRVETPLGPFTLVATAGGLGHCQPAGSPRLPAPSPDAPAAAHEQLARATAALAAYFDGVPDPWDGLALAPAGTHFQRAVWQALRSIPFGHTLSYRALARRIGRPGAARAIGQANHHNPLAILVPCHRVIAADGSLGGYAGGLARKRWLLEHEGARPRGLLRASA